MEYYVPSTHQKDFCNKKRRNNKQELDESDSLEATLNKDSVDKIRFRTHPATDPMAPGIAPARNFMYTGESGLPAPIASLMGT